MLGLRPVVEIMTINFSLLALDQIVNHAAKIYGMFGGQSSVPMVIRTPGGGGQQLGATHSQNVELFYSFIPGLKVVAPSTPAEASAMLKAAIRDDDPVLFLENLALYNTKAELPAPVEDIEPAEIGRAGVTREGTDITIIGYSRMARVAARSPKLAAEGVSAEVVDLRSLRPLDRQTIVDSVRKTGCAVVAEDDWLTYGIGAEIAATIQEGAFDWLDAPVRRVAMAEVPLPYAKSLESVALPSAESLLTAVRDTPAPPATRWRPFHDRNSHAAPLRHDGGGRHQLLAEEAGGRGRGRRRHRRHRDRQGGHGVRGLRGGVLEEILVPEGESAAIGAPIARIAPTGGAKQTAPTEPATEPEPEPEPAPQAEAEAEPEPAPAPRRPHGPQSVPRRPARRRRRWRATARDHGIDLATLSGSGPGGRIVRADIEAAIRGGTPAEAPPPRPRRRRRPSRRARRTRTSRPSRSTASRRWRPSG